MHPDSQVGKVTIKSIKLNLVLWILFTWFLVKNSNLGKTADTWKWMQLKGCGWEEWRKENEENMKLLFFMFFIVMVSWSFVNDEHEEFIIHPELIQAISQSLVYVEFMWLCTLSSVCVKISSSCVDREPHRYPAHLSLSWMCTALWLHTEQLVTRVRFHSVRSVIMAVLVWSS